MIDWCHTVNTLDGRSEGVELVESALDGGDGRVSVHTGPAIVYIEHFTTSHTV